MVLNYFPSFLKTPFFIVFESSSWIHFDIILTSFCNKEVEFFLAFFRLFCRLFLPVLVDFWVGPGVDFGRFGGRFWPVRGSILVDLGVDFGRLLGRPWGSPGNPNWLWLWL